MAMNIKDCFHNSEYVYIEEDLELIFVWHGGNIVNIYNFKFENIDCFTFMDNISVKEEIKEMIEQHIKEIQSQIGE